MLPYRGNKSAIAKDLVLFLRQSFDCQNFYDLFGGGGSITHVAAKYLKYVHYNEIRKDIFCAVKSVIEGWNFDVLPKSEWISREKFFEIKESNPTNELELARKGLVLTCWSFGNNLDGYIYSNEIEHWKKALHQYKIFNDFSLFNEFGIESLKDKSECKAKYIKWFVAKYHNTNAELNDIIANLESETRKTKEELRLYLCESLKKSGLTQAEVGRRLGTQMQSHYFGRSQWEFPTFEMYEKMSEFMELKPYYEIYEYFDLLQSLQSLERLQSLESLERLQSLQRLQSLERLQRISMTNFSYENVEIMPNSLIYCDIPYNSKSSKDSYGCDYDSFHAEFYDWALNNQNCVVFSEYHENVPKEFEIIWQKKKVNLMAGGGAKKSIEVLAWNKVGNINKTTLF